MSSTVISSGPPVNDEPVRVVGRCPRCKQEVYLFFSTWEGWWAVRTRPHGAGHIVQGKPVTVECGGFATLKRDRIR